jgi:hypothetical protein
MDMTILQQHDLYLPVMYFILGSIGTMAAFGAGLGTFLTTKTLTRLANKVYACIRHQESADIKAEKPLSKKEAARQNKAFLNQTSVSHKQIPAAAAADHNEIQKMIGERCNSCRVNGTPACTDSCPHHPRHISYFPEFQQHPQQPVSQYQHRPMPAAAPHEIQAEQSGGVYLGGSNDCYSYCKHFGQYGKCYQECTMAQAQTTPA